MNDPFASHRTIPSKTLDEERATDKKLTPPAKSKVNLHAAGRSV